jgi:hypothetical protein
MHKNFNNVPISHETVRKSFVILNDTHFSCDIEDLSVYCGYYEQWVKINGEKWKYRYVLFDLVHNLPIAEALYDNAESDNIKDFIKNNIPSNKRKVIVTDLLDDYDNIMDDLHFEHQKCSFHLAKNINKKIKEYLNKTKAEIRSKIKKAYPDLNKEQLKVEVEKKLKPIKEEINLFKHIFLDLFKQNSYKDTL